VFCEGFGDQRAEIGGTQLARMCDGGGRVGESVGSGVAIAVETR
jgi:hypothetical protein